MVVPCSDASIARAVDPQKRGKGKGHRQRTVCGRRDAAGDGVRRDCPQLGAAGNHPGHQLQARRAVGRVHDGHRRRCSRIESRRSDRRRSALPCERSHKSSRRTGRPAGASRSANGGAWSTSRRSSTSNLCRPCSRSRRRWRRARVIWGEDNLFKSYLVSRGDVDEAFRDAPTIVEGEYETGAQEQLYIEPNGMLAIADAESGVTVWGSMQCPYYIHKALVGLFNVAPEKVRVVQMETGGGFGGKEEYPSVIAGHAALLAWKSGRPVKLLYDRAEDMVATTKRHPSRTRHRTAIDRDGRLLAMDIEFVDRWRRLLHPVAGGAVSRNDPCGRAIFLPEHPDTRPRRCDQRAATRRVQGLRCAAEHLRARAPDGSRGRRRRSVAGRVPPAQLHQARADERRGSDDPRAGRHGRFADPGARAFRFSRKASPVRRSESTRHPSSAVSGSPPSCTAPASRDREKFISRRS